VNTGVVVCYDERGKTVHYGTWEWDRALECSSARRSISVFSNRKQNVPVYPAQRTTSGIPARMPPQAAGGNAIVC